MGELHQYYGSNSLQYDHSSQFIGAWDLQSLGVASRDMSLDYKSPTAFFSTSLEFDCSSGYLNDVLPEFNEYSKRRRLFLYADDNSTRVLNPSKNYWSNPDRYCDMDISANFSYRNCNLVPDLDEPINIISTSTMSNGSSDLEIGSLTGDNLMIRDQKPVIDSAPETTLDSLSSCCNYKSLLDDSPKPVMSVSTHTAMLHSAGENDNNNRSSISKKMTRRVMSTTTRVVYPFEVVKPGGVEGDTTINDINERILMPPTRPLRHPVGNFACRPSVSADGHGLGLSGKAVVALTRIHTRGRRGTITIIRTKG